MPNAVPTENIQVKREGTQVSLEIRVPKEAVRQKEEELLRVLAQELHVPGFRPGKAPRDLLLRRYGVENFWEEVRENLIQDWLDRALKEFSLHPLTTPKVKTLEFVKGESLAFQAEFEVLPEFTLPTDLQLTVEEPPAAEVREEEVEAVLADLRREAATLEPKDAPAEEGDVVHIRRGEHVWEGTATNARPLGRQLLGAKAGTRVILTDEEGHAEEFEVVGVYRLILPSPEETARHYGKETWEELKEEVRRELLARAEARRRDELRRRALDALAEALNIPVPAGFLAEAVEEEMKKFPKNPEVRAEVEKAVARRLRREILIHRLSEEKGLTPDPEEVRRIAAAEGEDEEIVHNRLLFERTADWVLENLRRSQ
ncbi:MAG: trigger factor [Candidatus Bipolaricaulaceae bacterium]